MNLGWFKKINRSWLLNSLLVLVFCLGIGIRLVHLQDPPLDFHLIRQLRSAIIARSVYFQLAPNLPADLVKQSTDLASLEIYEPPIFENIVGLTYYLIGSEQVWVARIYLTLFWGLGGLALWAFAKRYVSKMGVILCLCFYFFLPFSVVASRSFQPDPWMVMWVLFSLYAFNQWTVKQNWRWAVTAALCAGICCLVKIVAACFIAPMAILAVLSLYGWRKWAKQIQVWSMAGLVIVPSAIYYLFINTQRSGDFLSFWTGSLISMVLTTHFYAQWLAMVGSLFSLFPLLLALIGLTLIQSREHWLLSGLWFGYFLYGLIFPYQYITHEYYQLPLIALIALSMGPVIDRVLAGLSQIQWGWRLAAAGIIFFAVFYTFYVARSSLVARDYRNEPQAWKKIGEAIPADKTFVALTSDYGMRLRYYGWRSMSAGWPTNSDDYLFSLAGRGGIDDYDAYFKNFVSGKDLFVVLSFGELDRQPQLKEILSRYSIFASGDGYLIYDLTAPLIKP